MEGLLLQACEDTTMEEHEPCNNEIIEHEDAIEDYCYKDYGTHSLGYASDEENREMDDQCCDKEEENTESEERFFCKITEFGNEGEPKVGMIFKTTQKSYDFIIAVQEI